MLIKMATRSSFEQTQMVYSPANALYTRRSLEFDSLSGQNGNFPHFTSEKKIEDEKPDKHDQSARIPISCTTPIINSPWTHNLQRLNFYCFLDKKNFRGVQEKGGGVER